jgi:transcriptional regulator with XRE-family HTH domain
MRPTFDLPDRCRKAREEAGFNQVQLAAMIGIARSTVSNYETDAVSPRTVVLKVWAQVCGVEEDWLIHGDAERVPYRPRARRSLPMEMASS